MAKKPLDSAEMQKHIRRQFWCLIYARQSFVNARTAATQYLSLQPQQAKEMRNTFGCAAVVSYAMPFITNPTLGTLPGAYSSFPEADIEKRWMHQVMIETRNAVYAHIDSTDKDYFVEVTAALRVDDGIENAFVRYGYRQKVKTVNDFAFPKLVELCDYQLARLEKDIQEKLPLVLPTDTAMRLFKAERARDTTIQVFWPKRDNKG